MPTRRSPIERILAWYRCEIYRRDRGHRWYSPSWRRLWHRVAAGLFVAQDGRTAIRRAIRRRRISRPCHSVAFWSRSNKRPKCGAARRWDDGSAVSCAGQFCIAPGKRSLLDGAAQYSLETRGDETDHDQRRERPPVVAGKQRIAFLRLAPAFAVERPGDMKDAASDNDGGHPRRRGTAQALDRA